MNQILQDLRYALRILLKSPAFTVVTVMILALGSGGNTAIFSVLNAVVLRPLPYAESSRLYQLEGQTAQGPTWFSSPDLETWRSRTWVFEKMTAARPSSMILSGVDVPEQLLGKAVDLEYLTMFGVAPLRGRWFNAEDFRPVPQRNVLIGYRLWQRQFAGNPNILGRPVVLDGREYAIIGIMPPSFQSSERNHEFLIPLSISPEQAGNREFFDFQVYARARPGVTREQVQAESETISQALVQQFPAEHRHWRARADLLHERMVAEARPMLLLLLGVVGFVLLIACLNVTNLILARGTERAKEIAIRAALGAGRFRILRQLLTENLILALFGGAVGLLLASWVNRVLVSLFSQKTGLPRLEQTGIDGRVLGYTLILALVSSVLFGLMPALHASKIDLNETLKETGRSGSGGIRSSRFRNLLIVSEIALSVVLLVGAGLLLRSFVRLLQVDPGFRPERVWTARLPMPAYRVPDKKKQPAYYSQILHQVQAIPGVHSAGLATVLPLSGGEAIITIRTEHDDGTVDDNSFPFRAVSPDYFKALGIPLLMGRCFTDADTSEAPQVVIVNEALARQRWPGENPTGNRLRLQKWVQVVGVVGNIRHGGLDKAPQGELFLPYLQMLGTPNSMLVVRTHLDPIGITQAIRSKIHEYEPDQPLADIRTMEQMVSDSIARPRMYTGLLGIFAALALVLASAGVFGVMSYSVSQRQHEIGIRMALGARGRDILREFMNRGTRYVLIGLVIGLAGAIATTRLLSSQLFEVKGTDPATYLVASLLLLACALVAIYVPARRATRTDPLTALRHE